MGCASGGAVYTKWGSNKCSKSSFKLYGGFIAGSYYSHNGGGANYICMHENPQQPKEYSTGNQQGNLLYGTEYENTGARSLDKNANKDAACSVCRVSSSTTVHTQWGRTSCSNGHVTEYSGLVMGSYYTNQKAYSICVDLERAYHAQSSDSNSNGAQLYISEMEGGASDEGRYPSNREVACAVCSVPPTSPISVASTTTKATGVTTAAVLTSSVAIKAAFAAN